MTNTNNKQDCTHAKDLLLEEIQDGNFGTSELNLFLSKHEECKEELISFYEGWSGLGNLEVAGPSQAMDVGFYRQLSEFQAENRHIPITASATETRVIPLKLIRKRLLQISVAASIFMVGAITSFYLLSKNSNQEMFAGSGETGKNIVYAGYDQNESSMERLSDISDLKKAPKLNDKIINALNQALIQDPNINVRLSAIEAMLHYAENPKVRENLIKAIPYQDSPIIQLTLAEVMLELEGADSREEWKKLFDSDDMEPEVRIQLRETLAPVINL